MLKDVFAEMWYSTQQKWGLQFVEIQKKKKIYINKFISFPFVIVLLFGFCASSHNGTILTHPFLIAYCINQVTSNRSRVKRFEWIIGHF